MGTNREWSEGRMVNEAVSIPPIMVDCSGWDADIPAERWTVGRMVNLAESVPPVLIDAKDWDDEPAVGKLELVVRVEDGTSDEAVSSFAGRVVNLIAAIDPELRLTADRDGTRQETGAVRVVLTPVAQISDVGRRIDKVIRVVNTKLADEWENAPAFQLRKAA